MSDLYVKKLMKVDQKQAKKDAQNFKTHAINDLKKALDIVTTHFPENSPHITRIQLKIQNLNKEMN